MGLEKERLIHSYATPFANLSQTVRYQLNENVVVAERVEMVEDNRLIAVKARRQSMSKRFWIFFDTTNFEVICSRKSTGQLAVFQTRVSCFEATEPPGSFCALALYIPRKHF